jgi:1-acyl-sn-glycerol-3-phosphate acyltransferase
MTMSHSSSAFVFDHDNLPFQKSIQLLIAAPLILFRVLVLIFISFPLCGMINLIGNCFPKSKLVLSSMIQVFAKIVLACFGIFQIEVIGDNNMTSTLTEQGAHLLVSNHVNGHLDGFILMALFGSKYALVINQSVCRLPLIGNLLRIMNSIMVDPAKSIGVAQRIQSTLENGQSIAVFPEGGTTNGTVLMRFRSGAFWAPKVPIHMMTINLPRASLLSCECSSLSAKGEVLLSKSTALKYLLLAFVEPIHKVQVSFWGKLRTNDGVDELVGQPKADYVQKELSRLSGLLELKQFYRDFSHLPESSE